MDYTRIANTVIEFLQPLQTPSAELGTGVAANALWDWIKSRFKGRSAAAAEAVAAVEKTPSSGDDWEILKIQLRKALKEDETLARELVALLPKGCLPPGVSQNAIITGVGNALIQSSGTTGSIHVQH
jgi:hypothetical protein